MSRRMKLVIAPIILFALTACLYFTVWGASRIQLTTEASRVITGVWTEQNWDASDKYSAADYPSFTVKKDEEFRILAMTDLHYRNDGWYGNMFWTENTGNRKTDRDVEELIEEVKPQLMVFTGDIQTGSLNDLNYEAFTRFIDGFDIPWTVTFGNHDAETRADKPAIMNILQSASNCIFRQGPTNLGTEDEPYAGGLGNSVINLKDEQGFIFYSLILADSGDWQNSESNLINKKSGKHVFSREGVGFTDRQIDWYQWTLKGAQTYNDKLSQTSEIPTQSNLMPESMLICHIPMRAYEYAAILGDYSKSDASYTHNDLPFKTEAEWARPSDSDAETRNNQLIALYYVRVNAVKIVDLNSPEFSELTAQEKNFSPEEIAKELKKGFDLHRTNDLFYSKLIELNSTKQILTGHNHCDGYEVAWDGVTFISVVKTGDIYSDKEYDMGNRGGTLILVSKDAANRAKVRTKAVYTRTENYQSVRFPRPIA